MVEFISFVIKVFVVFLVGWLVVASLIMTYQEKTPTRALHFLSNGLALALSFLVAAGVLNTLLIFSWEAAGQAASLLCIRAIAKSQLIANFH